MNPFFFNKQHIFYLIACLLLLSSCEKQGPYALGKAHTEWVMGTLCRYSLPEVSDPTLFTAIGERLRRIEEIMSANQNTSTLGKINSGSGAFSIEAEPELIELTELSIEISFKTKKYFDPSIGPLVALWDIGSDNPRLPADREITQALSLLGLEDIVINHIDNSIFLKRKGMRLDLGAIAKGYAADEISRLLSEASIKYAVIDLGGNVLCHGTKPDGKPWRVGIQDPASQRGEYLGVLEIQTGSVVTSGKYERWFEHEGTRYHHILDPATGYPADSGLASVTILSSSSTLADAYSTALFVAGLDEGYPLALKEPLVEAIFVLENGKVHYTPGLEGRFSLASPDYHLAGTIE